MAEAFLREAVDGVVEVASAGSQPSGAVNRGAVETMAEIGIDISGGKSEHMNDYLDRGVQVVITVCGNADQACPAYPGQVQRYHWPFDDPSHVEGSEDHVKSEYRRVRDELKRVFSAYGRGWVDGGR
jgi:arsenate reductase